MSRKAAPMFVQYSDDSDDDALNKSTPADYLSVYPGNRQRTAPHPSEFASTGNWENKNSRANLYLAEDNEVSVQRPTGQWKPVGRQSAIADGGIVDEDCHQNSALTEIGGNRRSDDSLNSNVEGTSRTNSGKSGNRGCLNTPVSPVVVSDRKQMVNSTQNASPLHQTAASHETIARGGSASSSSSLICDNPAATLPLPRRTQMYCSAEDATSVQSRVKTLESDARKATANSPHSVSMGSDDNGVNSVFRLQKEQSNAASSSVTNSYSNATPEEGGKSYVNTWFSSPIKDLCSFVRVAHINRDNEFGHIQCVFLKESDAFNVQYHLMIGTRLLLTAKKMKMSRTAKYHLFDMTRGVPGAQMNKSSGNFIGKFRSHKSSQYSLVTHSSKEREELAGVVLDYVGPIQPSQNSTCSPRNMTVVVPQVDPHTHIPIPFTTSPSSTARGYGSIKPQAGSSAPSLCELLEDSECGGMNVFQTKDPELENGSYQLDFHGRVSTASVKNFQLVSLDDFDRVVCQFGKVGEGKFHLDFTSPLNAIQAFALALVQFSV